MDIPLLHFRFLGGSTRRDIRSTASCAAFDDVCKKLVGFYPDIFPSGCDAPSVDLVTMDVPLEGGRRVHCVYFKAVVSRAFWNVFCFSYHSPDGSAAMRQALLDASADEWHQALRGLTPDSRSFRLEAARRRQPEADSWSGQGCYIQSFPMPNGALAIFTGADIDWRKELQLPRTRPSRKERTKFSLPTQAHSSKTLPLRRKPMIFLFCLLFLLVGGGLGWYVTDAAQAWKDAKLAEQAQLIQRLQTQIREAELLLQQKETPPPASPSPEPDDPFSADRVLLPW